MDRTERERAATIAAAYGGDPRRWPDTPDGIDPSQLAEAREIDRVLDHASLPSPAPEARRAALARIAEAARLPQEPSVVTFRSRPARRMSPIWAPAAAVLVASFALGMYLGSTGIDMLPAGNESTTSIVALDDVDLTGVEDATALADSGSS